VQADSSQQANRPLLAVVFRLRVNYERGQHPTSAVMQGAPQSLQSGYRGNPKPRVAIKLRWISLVPSEITHMRE
jgi:hypothetical protein